MPSGSGTVTTSGSPVSPNIAAFSSSTAITAATSANIQTAIGASVYDAYGAAAARQANLSLLAGTYVNGDMCTYTASGTLLNCNTAIPSVGTWGALNYPTWVSGTPFVDVYKRQTLGNSSVTDTYLAGSAHIAGLTTAGVVTTNSSGLLSSEAIVPAANLPTATTIAQGAVRPDGTTITIAGGVISSTGGGSAGVSSLNSLSGAVNLVGGSGISVTPSGSSITIGNTGSGAIPPYFMVTSYGALPDMQPTAGVYTISASMTGGTSVINVSYPGGFAHPITSADVGKRGAFMNYGYAWSTTPFTTAPPYNFQICSVAGSNVTIGAVGTCASLNSITQTVSEVGIMWGTDNTTASNACVAAGLAVSGATCFFPAIPSVGNTYGFFTPGADSFGNSFYILPSSWDTGEYGTPAGGSGATFSCTPSSGKIASCSVTNAGNGLYKHSATLATTLAGGCPQGMAEGGCGGVFVTAQSNSSGQIPTGAGALTVVYGGFGLTQTVTGTVNALGGDGATATVSVSGGTTGAPVLGAGGDGYGAGSTLDYYLINSGGSTCNNIGGYGGSNYAGNGTATANSSGSIASIAVTHNATGCGSTPPIVVFGDFPCQQSGGTYVSPIWGQCSNMTPTVPPALPVNVLTASGVNLGGPNGASLGGVTLNNEWDTWARCV